MNKNNMFFLGIVLFYLVFSDQTFSIPPDQLFAQKWSDKCANLQGVETSEYVIFSETEQCDNFVDTFRVQSSCEPASFTAMDGNRLKMTLNNDENYIIEFLWASQISIMKVVSEKPFTLQQTRVLGRAVVRENLMTNYLYCP